MRLVDKAASWIVCLLGLVHLMVGHAAFLEPTDPRTWFASAGFLLIVTGLANLGAVDGATRMQTLAAATGAASILVIGVLLGVASPALFTQPQTLVLLGLGLFLIVRRLRALAF